MHNKLSQLIGLKWPKIDFSRWERLGAGHCLGSLGWGGQGGGWEVGECHQAFAMPSLGLVEEESHLSSLRLLEFTFLWLSSWGPCQLEAITRFQSSPRAPCPVTLSRTSSWAQLFGLGRSERGSLLFTEMESYATQPGGWHPIIRLICMQRHFTRASRQRSGGCEVPPCGWQQEMKHPLFSVKTLVPYLPSYYLRETPLSRLYFPPKAMLATEKPFVLLRWLQRNLCSCLSLLGIGGLSPAPCLLYLIQVVLPYILCRGNSVLVKK